MNTPVQTQQKAEPVRLDTRGGCKCRPCLCKTCTC